MASSFLLKSDKACPVIKIYKIINKPQSKYAYSLSNLMASE